MYDHKHEPIWPALRQLLPVGTFALGYSGWPASVLLHAAGATVSRPILLYR